MLNRGNGRMTLFDDESDYAAFERVLGEAVERSVAAPVAPGAGAIGVTLIAWCLMPNHWHLVLRTERDGDLARFVRWLTLTHTQRWHAHHGTAGGGHVYQGRYKSFPVETERYLAMVCRYVERNPVQAKLCRTPEAWRWSSLWAWREGPAALRDLIAPWPGPGATHRAQRPTRWLSRVKTPLKRSEQEALQASFHRGRPLGSSPWQTRMIEQFGLESTLRPRGRPKKRQADADSRNNGSRHLFSPRPKKRQADADSRNNGSRH
ncbi:MAG: transposase, partial [Phycisphaeraceae bacterium]